MTIRILCIAAVKSYQTRVVSRYLAERIKPPVMMATIVPVVTPVRTGYRPDCYIFTQHKLIEEAPKEEL